MYRKLDCLFEKCVHVGVCAYVCIGVCVRFVQHYV